MLDLEYLLQSNKDKILEIAKKWGAYNIRIFGSVAKGNYSSDSDIDFLVNFEKGRSIFDWSGLWLELEELLQHKIDVADEKSLKLRIKSEILGEAIPL